MRWRGTQCGWLAVALQLAAHQARRARTGRKLRQKWCIQPGAIDQSGRMSVVPVFVYGEGEESDMGFINRHTSRINAISRQRMTIVDVPWMVTDSHGAIRFVVK